MMNKIEFENIEKFLFDEEILELGCASIREMYEILEKYYLVIY